MTPSLQSIASILDEMFSYQVNWLNARSRFKMGVWARQTGKDHTATAEAVIDCLCHPGTLWIILAAGERQALESLAKAREWATRVHLGVDEYIETIPSPGARLTSAQVTFRNGARLMALPANPQTVRGYSANLILTEFAFHENPDEIWRAIYPSISNPLQGGAKQLRIISTPNGLRNKFAQLWEHGEGYYRSRVTIHEAIAAGLPLNAAELERGIADGEAWQQEYLCEFMDGASVLLPYELIGSCEHADATEFNEPPALQKGPGQLVAGIDFGRKRHLTVCWILQRVGKESWTREVLTLANHSVPEQVEALRPRLQRCHRVCLDYTGAGIGLGDYLVREFGEWKPAGARHGKIELCQFTTGLKAELFPRLRAAFENRELRIPASREIREDLHGIQRFVGMNGQITYRAAQTADGHSDRCTALALALRAVQAAPLSTGIRVLRNVDRWSRPTHAERMEEYRWRIRFRRSGIPYP